MKIAFFGLPLAAYLLTQDGHDVVFAGLSRRGAPGARRLARTIGEARVVVKPAVDAALTSRLQGLSPDLCVSWFWTKRLPMSVVDVARYRGVGVHPSLLPRHRGPDPTSWAILSGDAITGVTAHRIEAEYDTGAVLGQRSIPIDPGWNGWQLAKALDRPSLRLLREVCRAFADGQPPPELPQDETLATSAPFLEDDERVLRWSDTASAIVRRVRALAPSPGAIMEVGGHEIVVLHARAVASPALLEQPGESIVLGGRCFVRAADAAVELLDTEIDGELVRGAALEKFFSGSSQDAAGAADKRR